MNFRDAAFNVVEWYQNIFPLANTFAERENVTPGQPPTATQMVSINTFFDQACARH